jgi:hypothetical protein
MTLCERSQVASVVCQVVRECRKAWPLAEIYYSGIYPRFVEKCCERKDHMSLKLSRYKVVKMCKKGNYKF